MVCYKDSLTFYIYIYVADDLTSLETQAPTVCYVDTFTFLYVDDVRTSQETSLPSLLQG
jgi:hypothetical protein